MADRRATLIAGRFQRRAVAWTVPPLAPAGSRWNVRRPVEPLMAASAAQPSVRIFSQAPAACPEAAAVTATTVLSRRDTPAMPIGTTMRPRLCPPIASKVQESVCLSGAWIH